MSLPVEKSASDELRRSVAAAHVCHHFPPPTPEETTLTEKLLLYAGAVHLAGAVQTRSTQRQGQIRLDGTGAGARYLDTSTMLQFDYQGAGSIARYAGAQDFSEHLSPSWR